MNKCYLNGKEIESRNAVSLYNSSFLYGINVFEGIRAYRHLDSWIILDLQEHIDRLYYSANEMSFTIHFTKNDIQKQITNALIHFRSDVYLRITVFMDGENSWSSRQNTSLVLSVRDINSSLTDEKSANIFSLGVSSIKRISRHSLPPQIKAGSNYLNSRYATIEVGDRGFDLPILLDNDNYITESAGSCIYWFKNSALYTPSLEMDILPSITRRRILQVCKSLAIEVIEGSFGIKDIMKADGVFLAGTMMELSEVNRVENVSYNIGSAFFKRLKKGYKMSIFYKRNDDFELNHFNPSIS